MATILDVARLAGVSPSTASRVLTNKPHVRPELQQRVLSAAEELNYQVNQLARSMRRGYSKSIGLVVRDMLSANFGKICAAAEAEAGLHGYELLICNSNRNPEKERAYIHSLLEWQVDGLIVFAANANTDNIRNLNLAVPTVAASSETTSETADSIDSDWIAATARATSSLIALGHLRIGVLVWGEYRKGGRSGLDGYYDALLAGDLQIDPALVRHCNHEPDSSYDATLDLLRLTPPPSALVVMSPDLTPGALAALRENNVSIPRQMSIINLDDSVFARFHRPPISVMQRKVELLGSAAVQMILQRIEGKLPVDGRRTIVPFAFVDRGSTAVYSPHQGL